MITVKISWMLWWICNICWLLLFIVSVVFIWMRDIDAAGITQTSEVKYISLTLLLVAFIIPLVIQMVWMIINVVVKRVK